MPKVPSIKKKRGRPARRRNSAPTIQKNKSTEIMCEDILREINKSKNSEQIYKELLTEINKRVESTNESVKRTRESQEDETTEEIKSDKNETEKSPNKKKPKSKLPEHENNHIRHPAPGCNDPTCCIFVPKDPELANAPTRHTFVPSSNVQKEKAKDVFTLSSPVKLLGVTITQDDLDSLEEGKYIHSTIMEAFMALFEKYYEKEIAEHDILLMRPETAYMLQMGKKQECVEQILDPLKLWEKRLSLAPVIKKDDPDQQNGGDHISLMVIDTRSRTFAHLDPIKGYNEKCAKDLFVNIMTREFIDNDGCLPKYVENNDCKRQKNGYDCGPFVINYIWNMLEFIKSGMEYFVNRAINQIDEKNIRGTLRNTLISEIKNAEEKTVKKSDEEMEIVLLPIEENVAGKREKEVETEKEADKQKKEEEIEMLENIVKDIKKKGGPWEGIQQSIEELKNNETKNNSPHSTAQNVNGTRNNDNVGNGQANSKNKKEVLCKNFIHRVCNFGNYCRYTHPDICKEWEDNGRCEGVNGTCKMPHPQICIIHINKKHAGGETADMYTPETHSKGMCQSN